MAERVMQPGVPAEPPPEVSVVSPLRTAAGTSVTAALTITNRSSQPRVLSVSVLGLDADWLPRPTRSNAIPPGVTVTADLVISPSLGTVPARYPLAVAVQALDPAEGKPMSAAQLVDMEMIVDAPGQIDFNVAPVDARAAFGKRVQIAIRNRGMDVAPVLLEAQASEALRIALPAEEQMVAPGETLKLRGRVRVRPRLFGGTVRHAYTVTARSYGAPQHVEASMTTRAVFGPTMLKVTAILAFVSLWATLGVIFIPRLADFARNQAAARLSPQTPSVSSPATSGKGGTGSGGNGHSANGGGGGSGNGGSGTGGSGSGGSGTGGSGRSGNGTSGGGGTGGSGSGSGQTPGTVQLNGTVAAGQTPTGVNVSIRPTPLVAEDTVQAKQLPSTATQSFVPLGKIPSWALTTAPPSAVSPAQSASTQSDGAWSFSVHNPAYYLLTFSKPGYETQRYIVDSSTVNSTQPLKVHLAPGQGHLAGVVHGPGGKVVGGARVTITDGTNTITTSSDSKGAIGHWSVDGLSTPSDYLVTISHDGLSTESTLVPLLAGGTQSVDLTLRQGVASLIGRVRGRDAESTIVGLGGAQITVTDGTVTRSTTTITKAAPGTAAPVGAFHLPGLAAGNYTVTIQASGYLDQTQRITVKPGASSVTMNAVMSSSTGVVWGHVKGEVIGSDGNTTGQIQAEVDAGLTLTSPTNVYKITTTAGGLYMFNGVAPGTYVVSAQYAGLQPGFVTVTVGATGTARAEFVLRQAKVINDAVISGFVGDATNPSNTVTCLNA
ncbi:MAG TPA: carboxypeptidase regulatory-like domain-containing protein, partial [Jatrophihabitans sp.]|nr:carboxypeptidase regulatory-like domain-containing protein [Jatrophihabitans sp.]